MVTFRTRNFTKPMTWCSMHQEAESFCLWGMGGEGFLDCLSSQSIWYGSFKFAMHSHHVPNGLPRCSASSQWVLQDVPNSTSFLSPTTFAQSCHLGSYIGWPKEQLLHFYLGSENFYFGESPKFHFFLVMGQSKRPITKKKSELGRHPQLSTHSLV
jgi:hypothetical protein